MAQGLADALRNLQTSSGLTMAAVVGSDGLVIESVADTGVDSESICSVAANGLLMMDALTQELNSSAATMMTLEYENDTVLLAPIDQDNMLVLLAGPGTNLGRMRILMRRSMEGITSELSSM